jgi:hypothetical protein
MEQENKSSCSFPEQDDLKVVIIGHHDNYLQMAKERLSRQRMVIAAHFAKSLPFTRKPQIEHEPEPIKITLPYYDVHQNKTKRKPLGGRFAERFKNKIK